MTEPTPNKRFPKVRAYNKNRFLIDILLKHAYKENDFYFTNTKIYYIKLLGLLDIKEFSERG